MFALLMCLLDDYAFSRTYPMREEYFNTKTHYVVNNGVLNILLCVILTFLSLTEYDSKRVQEGGVRQSECARI